MTTPKKQDEETLREKILTIDTTFDLGDRKTEVFLVPNFYVDRLVEFITERDKRVANEAMLSELTRLKVDVNALHAEDRELERRWD